MPMSDDRMDRNDDQTVRTDDLGFDVAALPRGPGHSGSKIRVVAQCSRCIVENGRLYDPMRYEIGNGGNIKCPNCREIDRAHVEWREVGQNVWKAATLQCGMSGCSGEPTHEVVFVGRIEGTPSVASYVCEGHKDAVQVRPLEDE